MLISFINSKYGSKRGFVRYYRFFAEQLLYKRYSRYQEAPKLVDRVVFVCKGNICRSPLAEVVFNQNSSIPTASFGLDTRSGFPAHPPVVAASLVQGVDLFQHMTTCANDFVPQPNDLYICTEPSHVDQLQARFGVSNIILLGLYGKPNKIYIHDPYSANEEYIGNVVTYIINATKQLAQEINSLGNNQ